MRGRSSGLKPADGMRKTVCRFRTLPHPRSVDQKPIVLVQTYSSWKPHRYQATTSRPHFYSVLKSITEQKVNRSPKLPPSLYCKLVHDLGLRSNNRPRLVSRSPRRHLPTVLYLFLYSIGFPDKQINQTLIYCVRPLHRSSQPLPVFIVSYNAFTFWARMPIDWNRMPPDPLTFPSYSHNMFNTNCGLGPTIQSPVWVLKWAPISGYFPHLPSKSGRAAFSDAAFSSKCCGHVLVCVV